MKILFYSRLFFPENGGSVLIVDQLAEAWTNFGHEVTIFTPESIEDSQDDSNLGYNVLRGLPFKNLLREISKADFVVSMEVSLQAIVPSLLFNKSTLVTHQTWFYSELAIRPPSLHRRLQKLFAHRVVQIPCSLPIGENWGGRYQCIGNPYRKSIFSMTNQSRSYDFGFVGRVIYDKGPDLFLKALESLKACGWNGKAIVIGHGALMDQTKADAEGAGLSSSVHFAGWFSDEKLAHALNCCRVLVVPSRWKEPFGMVAVEGLASGCRVVVSSGGGLPEAAGALGYVFPNGDLGSLRAQMEKALEDGEYSSAELGVLREHLLQFEVATVAREYLRAGGVT